MAQFPYQFFNNFVTRSPVLSYRHFQKLFSQEEFDENKIKDTFSNSLLQEAIYLASPNLYKELFKWISQEKQFSKKEQKRLINTFLKYLSRMSSRCTPFGLFSGVGLGKFGNENSTMCVNTSQKLRDTKLDMHFLGALSQHLLTIPKIKKNILFFPNNSIYKIGEKIRYIEYESRNGKRDYIISSAPFSEELKTIVAFSKNGKTISQLVSTLINKEFSQNDVQAYIEELIDNQILISELEPNVAGDDFLDILIPILERIEATNEKEILISIKNKMIALDLHFGNSNLVYLEIEELIKKLNVSYDRSYLFQTDLYFDQKNQLSYLWKKELKKGISILNKITHLNNKDTHLEKFKKAFYERFENEEVPLSFVLDTEVGIGYRQDIQTKGIHPYINDVILPVSKEKQELNIKLNPFQVILNQKLQNAYVEREYIINLSDEDLKTFEENWNDLPDTMFFMTEIISENNHEKLYLNNGSGNAGRLLARFCSEKSNIKELVQDITQKEEELNSNKILAEIIHLSESRIGNILRRPKIRNYEIPYLAKSLLPFENQITVDDLYISMKNDRIVLRSKRLDKEIKPSLTNAHNYSANSLPVYHFLSDLNSQNTRFGLRFDWGGLTHIYNFLPRVEYGNIILSKAQWKISSEEIHLLVSLLNNTDQLRNEIKSWRNKKQIPQWVQWVKSDNTLVINLENQDLLSMFLSSVKNEKMILIEEFLHNEKDNFIHQFIFPIHKKQLN
ncbi:lantibiotic dehydratase family protein [Chryseobacterium salivictor]|uniref:Nisin biosynthesis protein NisB n=1 Tax=Chryseobacterium salivictor TaxID=2547600 RepID=A0A4P6ZI75_9FLAO|nr:lantibiotic dehydratase family protein [Chryseobacterium salivictor]QBO59556.1 Nisin biosynthesis protein NisB [Chryseobacterium salivictor]